MDHSVPTTSNQEGPKDPKEYIRALLLTMYYEQSEHLHSDFSEAYLKFRQVVCEWIVDVCEYFNLHITTTHAAICYLDRLQPNEKFSRFEWQMMAVCCIIIASKYNECEEHVPPLQKLGEITQQTIGNDILLEYELFSLKRMAWKLNVRSTMAFLCSYDELGLFSNSDIDTLNNLAEAAPADSQDENSVPSATKVNTLLRAMRHKVYKLGSKTLLDSRFKSFQSSAVASAVIFYARRCCCLSSPFGSALPAWTDELTKMTFHHPLRHRATTQALELIFEMEGESVEELRALVKADEKPVSNISLFDRETSYDEFISLSESSPVKRDSPASAVLVSPIATTSATGKDIDFSPVSMTTVFNTISP